MNIDVKNALDKVLNACEKIKSISTKDEGFRLITEYVVEDIYDFINAISLTGAEERFQYFDAVYLNGAFSDHAFGDNLLICRFWSPFFRRLKSPIFRGKRILFSPSAKSDLRVFLIGRTADCI